MRRRRGARPRMTHASLLNYIKIDIQNNSLKELKRKVCRYYDEIFTFFLGAQHKIPGFRLSENHTILVYILFLGNNFALFLSILHIDMIISNNSIPFRSAPPREKEAGRGASELRYFCCTKKRALCQKRIMPVKLQNRKTRPHRSRAAGRAAPSACVPAAPPAPAPRASDAGSAHRNRARAAAPAAPDAS